MLYRAIQPAPPLDDYIERFWLSAEVPPDSRARILPSGTLELVIHLHDDAIRIDDPAQPGRWQGLSGAIVSGAQSRFFVIEPSVHGSTIGVHFRPGGAFPFLGVPAGELGDTHVELETLWGPSAEEVRERLGEATTAEARISLLQEALMARLARAPDRHPAVPAVLAALGRVEETARVRDIAGQIGLSQRRLIEVFTAEVGITPKRYHRIHRFQRACELARPAAAPDWATVAVECGYFDQSHLIRDFQEFAGSSPGKLQRSGSEPPLPHNIAPAG